MALSFAARSYSLPRTYSASPSAKSPSYYPGLKYSIRSFATATPNPAIELKTTLSATGKDVTNTDKMFKNRKVITSEADPSFSNSL